MTTIKGIVYSDIHYDRLGARCITISDCEKVEKDIANRLVEGHFDFCLFVGDRYLRRNPEDEIKTRADRISSHFDKQIPRIHLIGNHDWVANSMKWHTSETLKDLGGSLVVVDQPQSISIGSTLVHCLPAGYQFDMSKYATDPSKFNIFLFHDMVRGGFFDDDNKVQIQDGLPLSEIDRPEFDIVFGGDIHVPQKLPFKNTKGGYVGSVIQRTRADADRQRGWVELIVDNSQNGWSIDMTFVPTRNFFTRVAFDVDAETTYESLSIDESRVDDQAVEVTLRGHKEDVDRIADDSHWKNYTLFCNARSIDIVRDYQTKQKDVVVDMSTSHGLFDDLGLYLDSGFADLGNINKDILFDILRQANV